MEQAISYVYATFPVLIKLIGHPHIIPYFYL